MSPIGKIFAVLNIVMAAVFLGFASNKLAAETNYKLQFDGLQESSDIVIKDLNSDLQVRRNEIATLQTDKQALDAARGKLQGEIEVMRGDLENSRTSQADNKKSLDSITSTLDQYQATAASNSERADQADTEKVAAIEARHSAEEARDDAKEAEGTALEALAVAKSDIVDLEVQRETLRKQKTSLENKLATVVEIYGVKLDEVISMPALNGQVLQVINTIEPGLVSINLGTKDGVQRGFTFDIWAGNTYKGQVRVESVREDLCTALITRPVEGTKIAGGDKAATRL